MTFVEVMIKYYQKTDPQMSYKEAYRHAKADYEWWREIFGVKDDKEEGPRDG